MNSFILFSIISLLFLGCAESAHDKPTASTVPSTTHAVATKAPTMNTTAHTMNTTVHTMNTTVHTMNTTAHTMNTTVHTMNTTVHTMNTTVHAVNTTAHTMNTTSMPPKVPKWTVNLDGKVNQTCLVAQFNVEMTIDYMKKDKMAGKVKLPLPPTASLGKLSRCNESEAVLALDFEKKWEVELMFAKKDSKTFVNSIALQYMEDDKFVNTSTPGKKHMASVTSDLFGVTTGNYYYCANPVDVGLQENVSFHLSAMKQTVTLHFSEVTLQALGNSSHADFTGTKEDCKADKKTNATVPIAVGIALAVLIVIVLIAYIIGRRRRRGGYQSV